MEISDILVFIDEYGYIALFIMLSAGTFFIPLPNEVLVMSGGFASSHGILHPILAFISSYLGIITAVTFWFFIGKSFGELALSFLVRKERAKRKFIKFQTAFEKHGDYTLGMTYFFPLLRHLGPVLAGMNKMRFWKFALFAYSSSFIWTVLFFSLGNKFGSSIDAVNVYLSKFSPYFIGGGCIIFTAIILLRYYTRKKYDRNE
ncbi:DedA family protein [Bacillus sp. PAMC26568]|nr:DedA family protein [Bacillus sp. PAMC26568]